MHSHQRRNLLRAFSLALGVSLTVGSGITAARPETGGRDIQDFAQASFQVRLDDCLFVDATVLYFAGDNLQVPLGSGKPGWWSDAPVSVGVFDSCDGDAEIIHLEGLGFPEPGPDFDRLDRASLDVTSVTLSGWGISVDAEIHLDWIRDGDVTVRIDHQLDGGYLRQERSAPAVVTGTVTFGDELTLTGDDAHDVVIGTANEISLP